MLNTEEIQKLFEKLAKKHGPLHKIEGDNYTGANLTPEQLRDYSDEFDISTDVIRTFSSEQMWLLLLELGDNGKLKLPFESEQAYFDHMAEVEKAGGFVAYMKQKKANKENSASLPSKKHR